MSEYLKTRLGDMEALMSETQKGQGDMATEFYCDLHGCGFSEFCGECVAAWKQAQAAVPAPPTRTEEPRKLTADDERWLNYPRKIGQYDGLCEANEAALARLAFLEAERDRLREQIETHRAWLRAECDRVVPANGASAISDQVCKTLQQFDALFSTERP